MNSIYIGILVILIFLLIYQWYVSSKDIREKEGFVGEKPCYGGISSKNRIGDDYFFTNYMLDTLMGRKEQINEQKEQDGKTINMLQDFKDNVLKSNNKYQSDLKQFNTLNQNIDGAFATMNNEVNRNIQEANTKKNNSISLIGSIGEKIGKALSMSADSSLDERLKPVVKTSLENQLNNVQQDMLNQNMAPLLGIAGRLSDRDTDIYKWQFLPQSGQSAPVRVDPISGEIQCLSFDGKNCDREWVGKNGTEFSKIDPNQVKPISCGKQLQDIEGTDGYSTPDHWCQKAYNHYAEQSIENNDYSSCPKGWTLIDQDKLICQAPPNYSKCPTVGEVRNLYPKECGKNVCSYFNQPNQIYNSNMKRDWAKSCNAQYPFKVNIKAISNNLMKPTKSVNEIIQNRIGNPQVNSLDKFSAMKNGVLVRGYRLNSSMRRGDKILENLITTTINFRWGAGTILGIQPNGADQIFLEFLGYLRIPQGITTIKFRLGSDDGSRLLIATNGEMKDLIPVIEMMNQQAFTTKESSNINVNAGSYIPFAVEFYENFGDAGVVLEWSLNGGAYQIVPRDAFFIDKSQCDNSFNMGINIPDIASKVDLSKLMAWNVDEQLWTPGQPNRIYEQIVFGSQIIAANLAVGNIGAVQFISGGGTSNGLNLVIERRDSNSAFVSLRNKEATRNYGTIVITIPSEYINNPPKININSVGFYLLPTNVFNNGAVSPLQPLNASNFERLDNTNCVYSRIPAPGMSGNGYKYLGDFDTFEQCAQSPNIGPEAKAITLHGTGFGGFSKQCYSINDTNTRVPERGATCGIRRN